MYNKLIRKLLDFFEKISRYKPSTLFISLINLHKLTYDWKMYRRIGITNFQYHPLENMKSLLKDVKTTAVISLLPQRRQRTLYKTVVGCGHNF